MRNESAPQQRRHVGFRQGLTFRQATITLGIVVVLGLFSGLIELYTDWGAMRAEIVNQTYGNLSLVTGSAGEALFQYNETLAEQVVNSLLLAGHVKRAKLKDHFDEYFVSAEREPYSAGGPLEDSLFGDLTAYHISLQHKDTAGNVHHVGSLEVYLASGEIAESFVRRGSRIVVLGVGQALLISALVVGIFYWMITRPLLRLHTSILGIDPMHPGAWPRPDLRKHRNDELGQIDQSLDDLMQAFQQGLEQRDLAQQENARLGAELEVSRRIQQILLPPQSELDGIAALDIAAYMEPASEVGGDYYDVLRHEHGIRIGIGDVTGHGLESGVVMLMIQSAVRTLLNTAEKDIVRTMQVLNATIYDNVQRMGCEKNLSLALLDYQPAKGQSEGSNVRGCLRTYGQHETILVVRRDGELESLDTDSLGFPIGLIDDISQFIGEFMVELNEGDTVVLYTDGVTEAANEQDELYGNERLGELVRQHHHESAACIRDRVVADIRRHIGQQVVYDDITLVVFKQR